MIIVIIKIIINQFIFINVVLVQQPQGQLERQQRNIGKIYKYKQQIKIFRKDIIKFHT